MSRLGGVVLLVCVMFSIVFASPRLNYEGFGDFLFFPYYNARGNTLTYFRFANISSDLTIVAKVRIREGMESKELADFVVCLSPNDVFSFWLANPNMFGLSFDRVVIIRGGDGSVLLADEDSASVPNFAVVDAYNAPNGGIVDPNRSFEGYVEVFGLKAFAADFGEALDSGLCKKLAETDFGGVAVNGRVYRPLDVPSVMMGEAYIFDIASTNTFAYRAVAVDGFASRPLAGGVGEEKPTLSDADGGVASIRSLFAADELYVFYNMEEFYSGRTDLVLNFVGKKEMLDEVIFGRRNSVSPYSSCNVTGLRGSHRYADCCVAFEVEIYDDKENRIWEFSPSGRKACYEVNYIPVRIANGSRDAMLNTELSHPLSSLEIPVSVSFATGWLKIIFDNPQPVVGYALQVFANKGFSHMMPMYRRNCSGEGYCSLGGSNPFSEWAVVNDP